MIEKTIDSLQSVSKAIIHLYNSTSEQQRRITFGKSIREIRQMAIDGVRMVLDSLGRLSQDTTQITLEYSPESFSGTEVKVAVDICNAVAAEWFSSGLPLIINLPATVELTGPHTYADQVELFCREFAYTDSTCISVHTHNDRGCGVAAAELGVLAGASRIEGTLFGNGERTGNVDLLTLALNCDSQGLNSGLDFSDIQDIINVYEQSTQMSVPPRHPYAGNMVFTAFSGSHQDAIKKGLEKRNRLIQQILILDQYRLLEQQLSGTLPDLREHVRRLSNEVWPNHGYESDDPRSLEVQTLCQSCWQENHEIALRPILEKQLPWDIPYLPIDPHDLGRSYEEIIRVNNQSGKGGLAYILQAEFGIQVPKAMGAQLGSDFAKIIDALGRELRKNEIYQYFHNFYVNINVPVQITSYQSSHYMKGPITECLFCFSFDENLSKSLLKNKLIGKGNGPIDALVHCITKELPYAAKLRLAFYNEQAIQSGADSEACTFVALEDQDNRDMFWGVGRNTDTSMASFLAVITCYNRFYAAKTNNQNTENHPNQLGSPLDNMPYHS